MHVTVLIDGLPTRVPTGCSAAAALAFALPPSPGVGVGCARRSVSGEPRAPLCGMGICHECRTTIDGRLRLACQTTVREGMRIETGLNAGASGAMQP
jgi:hypothetical protein